MLLTDGAETFSPRNSMHFWIIPRTNSNLVWICKKRNHETSKETQTARRRHQKHKKRKLFVFKTETFSEQTTLKVFVDRLCKFAWWYCSLKTMYFGRTYCLANFYYFCLNSQYDFLYYVYLYNIVNDRILGGREEFYEILFAKMLGCQDKRDMTNRFRILQSEYYRFSIEGWIESGILPFWIIQWYLVL